MKHNHHVMQWLALTTGANNTCCPYRYCAAIKQGCFHCEAFDYCHN